MDLKKFMRSGVMVLAIPEAEDRISEGQPHAGALVGSTTFWVRTEGMGRVFSKPELEMRGVPALFAHAASMELNHWASYMVDSSKPVLVGQTISTGDPIGTVLRVEDAAALDPEFWEGRKAYRLTSHVVHFKCGGAALRPVGH